MSAALDFAFWTAFLIAIAVGTFESMRRMARKGLRRKELTLLSACGVIALGFGGGYYWLHLKGTELAAGMEKIVHAQLPANWASDQAPEARENGSKSYASAAFLGEGILLKHVDRQGLWVVYQPSQNEIAERESAVAIKTRLREQASGFGRIAWTWWLSWLFALALGWLVGRYAPDAD